ncbi:MAG: T9SS type A sorting domain-containing protein [Bacteroidia bacterium]
MKGNLLLLFMAVAMGMNVYSQTPGILNAPNKVPSIYEEKIGDTQYDLQTNAAISNRFIRLGNGTMSAVWNYVQFGLPPTASNGGTGYNYFDGSAWAAWPITMVSAHNALYTNLAITASAKEMVIAHTHSSAGMIKTGRNSAGSGTWVDDTTAFGGFINDAWAKAISGGANGETVHAIWQGSGFYNVPLYGQVGPLLYSRSLDSGVTWPVLRTVIPSIDSNHYVGFAADNYSIDTKGDEVAIVVGSRTTDLILLKSLDNGTTWTTTIIDTFPIAFYNDSTMMLPDTNADGIGDNMKWNSGDAHVMIDNNGMCHVWYSKILIEDTSVAETLITHLNESDGLYYWNEGFGSTPPAIIAKAYDYNGNGIIEIPTTSTVVNGMGNYNGGITQMPSSGIDAAGNLYASYQSYDERTDITFYPGVGHKHVYVIKSPDNGITWSLPYDVLGASVDSTIEEGVYACIAKNVDAGVHLIYQRDYAPGHALSANVTEAGWNLDPSDIIYARIDTDAFGYKTSGINDLPPFDFRVAQNIPNPATNLTSINFTTTKTDKTTFTITDVVGKVVYTEDRGMVAPGSYTINFNANQINKGLYFYTVKVGVNSVTKKMIVE